MIESTVLPPSFPFSLSTPEGVRIDPVVAHALLAAFADMASHAGQEPDFLTKNGPDFGEQSISVGVYLTIRTGSRGQVRPSLVSYLIHLATSVLAEIIG